MAHLQSLAKLPRESQERRKGIRRIFKCTISPFIIFLIPFSWLFFCLALLLFVSSMYILKALQRFILRENLKSIFFLLTNNLNFFHHHSQSEAGDYR